MQAILAELGAGQLTWLTSLVACVAAIFIGAGGGAIGGALVGGKHMGYGLAAMLGCFFGPIAALPGVALALAIMAVL